MAAGRAARRNGRSPRPSISPSRRRATRKPRWSSAWRSSASAGPRPMRRSCRCCRTANMCASTSAGWSRRIAAASWSRSWKASSPATWSMISPPISRNSSTASPTTRSNGAICCASSGRDFIGAVGEIKDLRIGQVIDALDAMLAPHHLSAARRRRRSAPVPGLRRPAGCRSSSASSAPSSAARTIPNAAIHGRSRSAGADGGEEQAAKVLGQRPGDRPRSDAARRPLRSLCAARRGDGRGKAQARRPAARHRPGRSRSRNGAQAAVAATRGRPPSGETASRSSPASGASAPMCSTARPTPTSKPATRCSISASTAP